MNKVIISFTYYTHKYFKKGNTIKFKLDAQIKDYTLDYQ